MRILVDITHPVHVHFFRHAIQRWQAAGHAVLITSRAKDITHDLLAEYGFEHIPVGRMRSGVAGLGRELFERAHQLYRIAGEFQPDVATSEAGTFLVYGMFPRRVPTVIFSDTEHANVANAITYPLATVVVTPRAYSREIGPKQLRYNGFKELAYTHPSVFTPDPAVLKAEGLSPEEPFSIVRLVGWGASHDIGDHGVTNLEEIVAFLQQYGRVVISSEKPLSGRLQGLEIKGPRTNMLHLQAFARLLFGESATMASECAMLGTPAIFLSTSRRGYIDELQGRYGMVSAFHDPVHGQAQALQQAATLLADPDTPRLWQQKRAAMLSELIDVNAFIDTTVRQYARPASL